MGKNYNGGGDLLSGRNHGKVEKEKKRAGGRKMFTSEHFIWMALSAVFMAGMTGISVEKQ